MLTVTDDDMSLTDHRSDPSHPLHGTRADLGTSDTRGRSLRKHRPHPPGVLVHFGSPDPRSSGMDIGAYTFPRLDFPD